MREKLSTRALYAMVAVPLAALIAWTFIEYLSPANMLAVLTSTAFCG